MTVKRGEVYAVSIPGEDKASAAVVLTANWLSEYAPDVTVVPITTIPRSNFPTRIGLKAGEAGLRVESWIKCDQVTTIPRSLLGKNPVGRLSAVRMTAIDEAVSLTLGL